MNEQDQSIWDQYRRGRSAREPVELPDRWVWTRLDDFGDWGAGSTPRRTDPRYFGGPHNWFKSGELEDDPALGGPSDETITDKALSEFSLRMNQAGDVLIAMYGATIGRVAILDCAATTNQAVCACTCFAGVDNRYLFLLLKSWRPALVAMGVGGAQPNISREKIVRTPVPLPPREEQLRIVARVNEMMSLCDDLESSIQARHQGGRSLAGSLGALR